MGLIIIFYKKDKKLEKLYKNIFEALPDSIDKFYSLQILDVSDNVIQKLPVTIGQLRGLAQLNLAGNELEGLPESIGQLPNLTSIMLEGNRLQKLPESLKLIKQITSLLPKFGLTTLEKLRNPHNEMTDDHLASIYPEHLLEYKLIQATFDCDLDKMKMLLS